MKIWAVGIVLEDAHICYDRMQYGILVIPEVEVLLPDMKTIFNALL